MLHFACISQRLSPLPARFVFRGIGYLYRGAGKSLARPGGEQATATELQLLQATQKKKKSEGCPSN